MSQMDRPTSARRFENSSMTERKIERYDAILFDMDGVLLQGVTTLPEVYQRAAHDVIEEFDLVVPEERLPRLEKYTYDDQLADCCRAVGIDPERFWETRERYASERANRLLREGSREPFPDTAVLSELSAVLGVVSNNRDTTVKFVADNLLPGEFAVAMGRDPTVEGFRRRKPDSYYIDRALSELDVDRALYVGDRQSDVVAAYSAGIDAAFLRREHNSVMSVDPEPTLELQGLDELVDFVDEA